MSKECEDADSNPRCPYLAVINECQESIGRIEKALIGEDLQGGLVAKVKDIDQKLAVQESWHHFAQPIVTAVSASLITALIIFLFSHVH